MESKWMELSFNKRICFRYIASSKDEERCACGQVKAYHKTRGDANVEREESATEVWNPMTHTITAPTDAFGTIDFHDGPHPNKAQYTRLAHDSSSERIVQLLTRGWGLELPKLIISVHGGKANFDLSPRLKKIVQTGLLRAAKTTGAWLLTGGTNTGVTRHVGDALISERSPRLRSGRVVSIGIAPWGVIENRHMLVGCKKDVPYISIDQPRSKFAVLNNRHAYFLLVDNGTVGHSGAEIPLRRKLEKYISGQPLPVRTRCPIPVVCVIIEGGMHTIRTVLEFVTDSPPVPVVVCEGSGRAADLIAFAYNYASDGDGCLLDPTMKRQLLAAIHSNFKVDDRVAEKLYTELLLCVKKKNLITIFRPSDDISSNDRGDCDNLDEAVLRALFRSRHIAATEQLSLALAWNRVDIARTDIFVYGQEWPEGALDEAMMDALDKNRVDFVGLLLEKGVHMTKFLTISRLEELYNSKQGPANTLHYIVRDVRPSMSKNYSYTLIDIGLVINKLMGGAYRSFYTKRKFRQIYDTINSKNAANSTFPSISKRRVGFTKMKADQVNATHSAAMVAEMVFKEPFNDLLIWAVLTKRQTMALLMWQHGEQALAKALVANKIYRSLALEAADDDLEVEISDELRGYASVFESSALELLDYCYRQDDDLARQLLTCELPKWSRQNCLRLAVTCQHLDLLAHPCSQMILSDLWLGGLRSRRWTNIKVILSLIFPPAILKLEFKSKEELQLMPQTEEEHLVGIKEGQLADLNSSSSTEFYQANGTLNEYESNEFVDSSSQKRGQQQLNFRKKIYEFYAAPVTTFWGHSMAHVAFLLIYTYTLLIKLPEVPAWNEYYVMAYIATFGCEKIREIMASEPIQLRQKLTVWLYNWWNLCDAVMTLEFFLGVALRIDGYLIDYARVFYCLNIIYWYGRILRLFMVSKFLGPFVVMIGKMAYSMMRFVALMIVAVTTYGVFRQTLRNPDEEWSWRLVRHIFFTPYFNIYGEIFPEEIDPPCYRNDSGQVDQVDGEMKECVTGQWLNPLMMAFYMLGAYILLVNLLIALINSIYAKTSIISRQIWKFNRFSIIMEHEQKPTLPPPFILFSHIFLVLKWCRRRAKGMKESYDQGLTLFLDDEDLERLYDFEEECMEGLANEKKAELQLSNDEKIRQLDDKIEKMGLKVENYLQRCLIQSKQIQAFDMRVMRLEDIANQINSTLAWQLNERRMSETTLKEAHPRKKKMSVSDTVELGHDMTKEKFTKHLAPPPNVKGRRPSFASHELASDTDESAILSGSELTPANRTRTRRGETSSRHAVGSTDVTGFLEPYESPLVLRRRLQASCVGDDWRHEQPDS